MDEKIFKLTNPGRILYPEQNITKLDLAKYYYCIKDWILPYIINRPLVLVRCPSGYDKECFYQKHFTEAITKPFYPIRIKEKKKNDEYIYIKNIDGVIELVQRGVLEIHPWGARVDDFEKPDMIIIDLDPGPGIEWKQVINTAFFVREELEKLNLISFVKTTGGKGLHVVVPFKRRYSWDEIKDFTHVFVEYLVSLKPKNYVSKMTKSKREGKIFIDYLRNQRGATAVAAYSTRARKNAPVSTPLSWDELTVKIKPDQFNVKNLPQRLAKLKQDPWEEFFNVKQQLKLG